VTGHCTSCGACCDPVSLDHTFSRDELLTIANGIAQGGDADDAPTSNYNPRNLHWLLFELKPLGAGYFACANFDAVTRQCNAYDTRPGVCAGFPWYGRQPYAGLLTGRLAGCGYAVDVPGAPDPQD
jgi:Fe-S-cluster containining protein